MAKIRAASPLPSPAYQRRLQSALTAKSTEALQKAVPIILEAESSLRFDPDDMAGNIVKEIYQGLTNDQRNRLMAMVAQSQSPEYARMVESTLGAEQMTGIPERRDALTDLFEQPPPPDAPAFVMPDRPEGEMPTRNRSIDREQMAATPVPVDPPVKRYTRGDIPKSERTPKELGIPEMETRSPKDRGVMPQEAQAKRVEAIERAGKIAIPQPIKRDFSTRSTGLGQENPGPEKVEIVPPTDAQAMKWEQSQQDRFDRAIINAIANNDPLDLDRVLPGWRDFVFSDTGEPATPQLLARLVVNRMTPTDPQMRRILLANVEPLVARGFHPPAARPVTLTDDGLVPTKMEPVSSRGTFSRVREASRDAGPQVDPPTYTAEELARLDSDSQPPLDELEEVTRQINEDVQQLSEPVQGELPIEPIPLSDDVPAFTQTTINPLDDAPGPLTTSEMASILGEPAALSPEPPQPLAMDPVTPEPLAPEPLTPTPEQPFDVSDLDMSWMQPQQVPNPPPPPRTFLQGAYDRLSYPIRKAPIRTLGAVGGAGLFLGSSEPGYEPDVPADVDTRAQAMLDGRSLMANPESRIGMDPVDQAIRNPDAAITDGGWSRIEDRIRRYRRSPYAARPLGTMGNMAQ